MKRGLKKKKSLSHNESIIAAGMSVEAEDTFVSVNSDFLYQVLHIPERNSRHGCANTVEQPSLPSHCMRGL